MIDKRKLIAALTTELSVYDFTKEGSTWYLRNEEVIAVLNLQKSNYDNTFFINLGFWLRTIEEDGLPKSERCHVITRAEAIWPTLNPSIDDLLGPSTRGEDCTDRIIEFRTFVRERIIPFLLEGSTINGIIALLKKYDAFLVRRVAAKALSLETE